MKHKYYLTEAGRAYLEYTTPIEQHDDDRSETELERLYRELDESIEDMRQAGNDDDRFIDARDRVKSLRFQIYELENAE